MLYRERQHSATCTCGAYERFVTAATYLLPL
jgi:hypothetical protein